MDVQTVKDLHEGDYFHAVFPIDHKGLLPNVLYKVVTQEAGGIYAEGHLENQGVTKFWLPNFTKVTKYDLSWLLQSEP